MSGDIPVTVPTFVYWPGTAVAVFEQVVLAPAASDGIVQIAPCLSSVTCTLVSAVMLLFATL